jgi:hypothetical protein
MRALAASMISFFVLGLCGVANAAPRYFPLDQGNTWTYVDPNRAGAGELKISVKGEQGGLIVVDFYGTEGLIEDRGDELDIEIPDEGGLVPYYRFKEATFVHHDVFSCETGRDMTAAATDDVVDTPAGVFEGCLRLEYGPGHCADAGRSVEWWKADVGLVKWVEESFIGPRTHVLQSYGPAPTTETFRRGDTDGDGSLVISDAISILNYLFTGTGHAPSCEDAADVNDDGVLNIGDPIFLLGYMFLGSATPPAPGPDNCGEDPTPDTLPTCDFPSCKQGFGT